MAVLPASKDAVSLSHHVQRCSKIKLLVLTKIEYKKLTETIFQIFHVLCKIMELFDLNCINNNFPSHERRLNKSRNPSRSDEGFFMSVDTDFVQTTSKDQYVVTPRDVYAMRLLNRLKKSGPVSNEKVVYLISSSGSKVRMQLSLFRAANTYISSLLSGALNYDSDDIAISLPCTTDTLNHLRDLLMDGFSVFSGCEEEKFIREIAKALKLNIECEVKANCISDDGSNILYTSSKDVMEENAVLNEFWSAGNYQPLYHTSKRKCAFNCTNNCSEVCADWDEDDRIFVHKLFNAERLKDTKNKLIKHLCAQEHIGGIRTNAFVINGHRFCTKYLSDLTGISEYILNKVLREFGLGFRLYEHASKGIIRQPSLATLNFIGWFRNFLQLYGQSAPDEQVIVLPYWLKGKTLFGIYEEEVKKPRIALKTFYHHLDNLFGPRRIDKRFPCVRFSKYSSHSVCDTCLALNAEQQRCKSEAELEFVKAKRNSHMLEYVMARKTVECIKYSALNFPSEHLFIQIDGMSNFQSYCPRYLEN